MREAFHMTYEPLKAITPPENHWPKQLNEIPHVKSGIVTTRVTGVHPNLTTGVWANHIYNCWNGTFGVATTMLHT
jgi:hypothetical protein